MAEIHIEKKNRSPLPVLIAVAVLLGLIIWWVLNGRGAAGIAATDSADTGAVLMSTGETDTELPSAVAVFLRWSDERITPSAMNPDHSHTATGIRNLAAALEGLAARAGVDIAAEANIIRGQADTLWANVASTRHADFTRKAFLSLSGLMGAVEQRMAPDLGNEVAEVRRAAEAIRADEALLSQRDRVQDFFERSATVVRQLSETRSR